MSVSWEEGDREEVDFVTLAKAGGRKDLLYHHEHERQEDAVSYPPSVEWFTHPRSARGGRESSPFKSHLAGSWMVWDTNSSERLPRLCNQAPSQQHRLQQGEATTKLPPLPRHGGTTVVDMKRILSLDYQREWLEEKEERKRASQRKAKAKRLAQKKKLEEHTIKQRAINVTHSPPKQRFIMKRFSKVSPKLKLPPL